MNVEIITEKWNETTIWLDFRLAIGFLAFFLLPFDLGEIAAFGFKFVAPKLKEIYSVAPWDMEIYSATPWGCVFKKFQPKRKIFNYDLAWIFCILVIIEFNTLFSITSIRKGVTVGGGRMVWQFHRRYLECYKLD